MRTLKISASIAAVMVALVAVACGGPTDTEPPVSTVATGTTVTLGIDSKWQVPSEFDVGLPLTHEQVEVMIRNDRGGPPDIPEFTMSGEVATDEGPERVLIIIYSDGVSTEARPMEVLRPWLKLVQGADLGEGEITLVDQGGLEWALWRGQTLGFGQSSPQGVILTVISDPKTSMVWRLGCLATSEVMSDKVATVCEQVRDGFRPYSLTANAP